MYARYLFDCLCSLFFLSQMVGDRLVNNFVHSHGTWMTTAGYSSLATGAWLAQPTNGVLSTGIDSDAALCFFREAQLFGLLDTNILKSERISLSEAELTTPSEVAEIGGYDLYPTTNHLRSHFILCEQGRGCHGI